MKKFIFLIIACLAIQIAHTQITINNNNFLNAGYYAVMATDTALTTQISPGPAGPNQNWDFSALTLLFKDTTWFLMPDWTPYANQFPNSNFAGFGMGENMYLYFYRDNSELSLLGTVMYSSDLGDTVFVPIVPKDPIIKFPANFNDSYTDNFDRIIKIASPFPQYDSLKMLMATAKTTTIDGWGTITTPLGAFSSLRSKDYIIQNTQVLVLFAGVWTMLTSEVDTSYSYTWWSDDPTTGFPVLEMYMDENNMFVDNYSYLAEPGMMNIPDNNSGISFQVYPNPARDFITIDFEKNTSANIELINISGQIVKKYDFRGAKSELNIESLPEGIYTLIIRENNTSKSSTLKVCIQ